MQKETISQSENIATVMLSEAEARQGQLSINIRVIPFQK
jgi:hypothetical protein